jgi:hypothetical protein
MREIEVGKDRNLEDLQAELEAARARVTELEQRLRLIHESRTYRAASRMWRVRARTRALFFRRRLEESRGPSKTAGDEVNGGVSEIEPASQDAQPLLYYGSRGVRETDPERPGPLRAVLLLGGLTERQLDRELHALAFDDAADSEPLVVTDCDALRTLDSAGYLYEYIPPREDWERHLGRNGDDYDEFVRRRLASIAGMYGLPGVPSIS